MGRSIEQIIIEHIESGKDIQLIETNTTFKIMINVVYVATNVFDLTCSECEELDIDFIVNYFL